jgi:DNA helicase-2/ATP-dependent DNA helicase PcrA
MAKQVILAVAGAGKTYYICHKLDPQKRNLILAFTHENIHNIQKELCNAYKRIPELTTVATFDSFVYHELILPYEPSIAKHFKQPEFVSGGICMTDPPPQRIKTKRGRFIANPLYKCKEQLEHYITSRNQYYCATLSELVLQVKKNKKSLIKRLAARLNMFYDCVMIDEFQDFREHDYNLIIALAKQLNDVVLVGDYYQHSVLATNNSGRPFKKKSVDVSYDEFIDELKCEGFEVDITTLDKSRRCSKDVCEYVRNKLGIEIVSSGINPGSVIWVEENASYILEDPSIIKLVYNGASRYTFRAMNWSYSKGDTVDAACIILTDDFEKLADDSFSTNHISVITLNRLYVAMTRSRGNLYLMRFSTFKKIRDSYIKI